MSKAAEYFEMFEQLGTTAAVARHYGVSRQCVHQYLADLPEFQKYRRPKPAPAPPCPNCESDRTINNGVEPRTKRRQYVCKECEYKWLKPKHHQQNGDS